MKSTALPLLTPGQARQQSFPLVFLAGAIIGVLGGMIGLGGAEFRLPLLIGLFGFAALQAIIMNKAMSLIVVITALPARLFAVPLCELSPHWYIVLNLLAGSLLGAWIGAHWATRLKSKTLFRVIAVLLVLIAVLLFVTHFFAVEPLTMDPASRTVLGVAAGILIGVVAARMGVAGGELLIPTIVLLYGTDIKIAGSLSLVVSLPTMLVPFARFSRDKSFAVLGQSKPFLITMTLGSITEPYSAAYSWESSQTWSSSPCWSCSCFCHRSKSGTTTNNSPSP
ncbi:putative membrane protein YfcA [Arthrobacter pascens]|uniref:sulfite exporter TauE/SafE family protein n=1 Tax=Arthrobacter pascens TaxID=1677 RepID=UPI0027894A7A|nr:sulfite exporter TauE/SafE family protein [Arthrobacter pascens]MDQ0635076.1 putative membrane protein YfcA [Arthrobacter pascens]